MEEYSIKHYKGVRDFYPKRMTRLRTFFDVTSNAARLFGFIEYGASPLEFAELYKEKKDARSLEDIYTKELYIFKDKGDIDVALRPEMTPTLKRMVSNIIYNKKFNKDIPMRWFSIPNVFRYEKPQKGRSREHYQFNADIVGIDSIWADVEIINVVNTILKNIGLDEKDYEILINSRKSIGEHFENANINIEKHQEIFRIIDKKDKIGEQEFINLMNKIDTNALKVFELYTHKTPNDINIIISLLSSLNIKVIFTPSLMRGFDYYTGIIFEVFSNNSNNKRSICGGGRYNKYIKICNQYYPAVGVGIGDYVLDNILQENVIKPISKKYIDIIIVSSIDNIDKINKLQVNLHKHNISCSIVYSEDSKQLGNLYKNIENITNFALYIDKNLKMNLRFLPNQDNEEVHDISAVIHKINTNV